jgi:hypothetical protein
MGGAGWTGMGASQRWRIGFGVGLAALTVAAVGFAARGGGEGAVEVVDTTTSTSAAVQTTTSSTAPPELAAPAGPRDGMDSLGHPVTIDPASDLADGDQVTVVGTEFPVATGVGIVMCHVNALGPDDMNRGISSCEIAGYGQTRTDADGGFTGGFAVRRFITTPNEGFVDCFEQQCIVAAGALNDYDESGAAAVTFNGSEPVPPIPTISLSQTDGLRHGDRIEVSVTDPHGESSPLPAICLAGRLDVCHTLVEHDSVFVDGAATPMSRLILAWPTGGTSLVRVDCALEPCEVRLLDGLNARAAPVPVAFVDEALPTPRLLLGTTSGWRAGDRVSVEIETPESMEPIDSLDGAHSIALCVPTGECTHMSLTVDGDQQQLIVPAGVISVGGTSTSASLTTLDCAQVACEARLFGIDYPLFDFAEPVPVTFAPVAAATETSLRLMLESIVGTTATVHVTATGIGTESVISLCRDPSAFNCRQAVTLAAADLDQRFEFDVAGCDDGVCRVSITFGEFGGFAGADLPVDADGVLPEGSIGSAWIHSD